MSIVDLAEALEEAGILNLLGMSQEDLIAGPADVDLVETLRISYDLVLVLRGSDTLDTFLKLPRPDQENFLRWFGSTDNRTLRTTRTETFMSALKMSPLGSLHDHPSDGR